MGIFLGGFAGYITLTLWPGLSSWLLTARAELLLAVAIPVGIVEYFTKAWLLTWIATIARLHVRRVAIFDGKLYIDQVPG